MSRLYILMLAVLLTSDVALAERRMAEEAILFDRLKASVFTIYSDEGKGTGFLVDSLGLVVTNAHVVASSDYIRVVVDDTTKVEAKVLSKDEQEDIAVLRIHASFCAGLPVLPLVDPQGDYAFVGERVFAIGSPLHQERVLTTGVVSKVEGGAILTDVNVNPGSSGGPLLNLDGAVIAVNTFRDVSGEGGGGMAGSIGVGPLAEAIRRARESMKAADAPSLERFPLMPRDAYPLAALRAAAEDPTALRSNSYEGVGYSSRRQELRQELWRKKPYAISEMTNTKGYVVRALTPPFLYLLEHESELRLAEKRKTRVGSVPAREYDPFEDLKSWGKYVGGWAPTVILEIVPKIGATFGGLKFKGDLESFALVRDGTVVQELQRHMSWQPLQFMDAGGGSSFDLARAGVYQFSPQVFAPTAAGWPAIELVIETAGKDRALRCTLPQRTLERITLDFEPYEWEVSARNARLVAAAGAGASDPGEAGTVPRVGMRPSEAAALFGPPASTLSRAFGNLLGEPWRGLVCEYVGDEDPRFRDEPRRLRNRLVFALVGGDSLLNHWFPEWPESQAGAGGGPEKASGER